MRTITSALSAVTQSLHTYISGTGTFELQVMATDLDAFSRFSIDTLLNLPNVKDIHTSFSLGEVKASGVLPLGHLKG